MKNPNGNHNASVIGGASGFSPGTRLSNKFNQSPATKTNIQQELHRNNSQEMMYNNPNNIVTDHYPIT
jgi:hypothetical protein